MKSLNYLDFKNFEFKDLSNQVCGILSKGSGVCIIKNFPVSEDDSELVRFSKALGEPVTETRNIDGKYVYRVEVNNSLKVPTYANTSYQFLCHTDCCEFEEPPDTVILLCEKQAESGGESHVVFGEALINYFSITEFNLLSQPVFPFEGAFRPIVSLENDQIVFRYNRVNIDFYIKAFDLNIEAKIIQVLDKLDDVMDKNKISFILGESECLILNNKTILHGRSSFSESSNRLMKRVRLILNKQ